MEKALISKTVTVTPVKRPARKLILLRSVKSIDYLSYCAEMGCDWERLLNAIPGKYDTAALLTLPPDLVITGTGNTASGVELSPDEAGPIPEGYDMIDLPACTMLYFQGMPYDDENDYGKAIAIVWEAMESYHPLQHGWQYADELAPKFNFGASAKAGARMAIPVVPVNAKGI